MSDDDRHRRLAELRDSFKRRLLTEAAALSCLLGELEAAPDDRQTRLAITHLVHLLAGGAGVFGFAKISREAAEIEEFLIAGVESSIVHDRISELTALMLTAGIPVLS